MSTDGLPPQHGNLDAAFAMANKWREASGNNILSAWMPAVKGDANACLLARAFNSQVEVGYESTRHDQPGAIGEPNRRSYDPDSEYQMLSGSGIAFFLDEATAEHFAEVTGFELNDTEDCAVRLPDEIALVAWDFDNGRLDHWAVEPDAELTP